MTRSLIIRTWPGGGVRKQFTSPLDPGTDLVRVGLRNRFLPAPFLCMTMIQKEDILGHAFDVRILGDDFVVLKRRVKCRSEGMHW